MNRPKFEDRLIVFAGECVLFINGLPNDSAGEYYADQLLRAAGSSALHYGEAQGTVTTKDFVYKVSGVLKELKECTVILSILQYINYGELKKRNILKDEAQELSAIAARMILNKKNREI